MRLPPVMLGVIPMGFVLAVTTADGAATKAGQLDPAFGHRGLASSFDGYRVSDVAVTASGRIVAVGPGGTRTRLGFALVRYLPNGRVDRSFRSPRLVTFGPRANDSSWPEAVALTSSGKIVAAGWACMGCRARTDSPSAFAVARYRGDGRLDPTFGSGGKAITRFGRSTMGVLAVATTRDGKIVAAGSASSRAVLVRYRVDGTLDRSFGGDGIVLGEAEGGRVTSIVVAPDGKILATGWGLARPASCCAELVRYRVNGTRDLSFGSGGVAVGTGGMHAYALARRADGTVLVAGGEDDSFAVVGYTSDGQVDKSFGSDGKIVTDFDGSSDPLQSLSEGADAVVVSSDGKIVLGGFAEGDGYEGNRFALARYTAKGRIDRTFGNDGTTVTTLGCGGGGIRALATTPRGKVLAAGQASCAGHSWGVIAQYLTH